MLAQVISLKCTVLVSMSLPSSNSSASVWPGSADAVHFGAVGKLVEDRVQIRITERAHVSDLDAEAGERVGHDRAVAAQFGALVDQFDVRALARGGGQALRRSCAMVGMR